MYSHFGRLKTFKAPTKRTQHFNKTHCNIVLSCCEITSDLCYFQPFWQNCVLGILPILFLSIFRVLLIFSNSVHRVLTLVKQYAKRKVIKNGNYAQSTPEREASSQRLSIRVFSKNGVIFWIKEKRKQIQDKKKKKNVYTRPPHENRAGLMCCLCISY